MTSTICFIAALLAILTIPALILYRITESKQQKAKRMRNYGHTYKTIAQRLSISQTTARRYATA